MTSRILVLGGGVSGLSTSFYLKNYLPKHHVTLLESNDKTGGWMKTRRHVETGQLMELGPHSLRYNKNHIEGANLNHLIVSTGIAKNVLNVPKLNRTIYYPEQDKLITINADPKQSAMSKSRQTVDLLNDLGLVTFNPISLMKWFFSNKDRIKQNFDWSGREDRDFSIKDILKNTELDQFDKSLFNVAEQSISSIMRGIYAGDVNKLSIRGDYIRSFTAFHKSDNKSNTRKVLKKYLTDECFTAASDKQAMEKLNNSENSIIQFNKGIQTLPTALVKKLNEPTIENFSLEKNSRVISISNQNKIFKVKTLNPKTDEIFEYETKKLISCLPAPTLARILSQNVMDSPLEKLSQNLFKIPYAPVALVHLAWSKDSPVTLPEGPDGSFGHLTPGSGFKQTKCQNFKPQVLGMIYNSNLTQNRPSNQDSKIGVYLTVMVGGTFWDDQLCGSHVGFEGLLNETSNSHSKIKNLAIEVCEQQLGYLFKAHEPILSKVDILDEAIPQYNVGHKNILDECNKIIYDSDLRDNLFLNGNGFYGVGVPSTLLSSHILARYICEKSEESLNVKFSS